jgi:hypothetical protein
VETINRLVPCDGVSSCYHLTSALHRQGLARQDTTYRQLDTYRNFQSLAQHLISKTRKQIGSNFLSILTLISTARTYLSSTNRSGLMRAFHPYVVLWGFDHFSSSYVSLKFYSALCVFVCTSLWTTQRDHRNKHHHESSPY